MRKKKESQQESPTLKSEQNSFNQMSTEEFSKLLKERFGVTERKPSAQAQILFTGRPLPGLTKGTSEKQE